MKHLILGAGNLGLDLFLTLSKTKDHLPVVMSKSNGLDVLNFKHLMRHITDNSYDCVWYAIGGGSIQESKDDYNKAHYLNCTLPIYLADSLPENTKLVVFSTDYVASESEWNNPKRSVFQPRSLYAQSKLECETYIKHSSRPNTCIARVTSLYGVHKPDKTFPGKILKNFAFNENQISLPENHVTPTPTPWLAKVLLRGMDQLFSPTKTLVHHVAPNGSVSVNDWAKFVLEGIKSHYYFTDQEHYDEERPPFSALGCSLDLHNFHWYDLFKFYYDPQYYVPREYAARLDKILRRETELY